MYYNLKMVILVTVSLATSLYKSYHYVKATNSHYDRMKVMTSFTQNNCNPTFMVTHNFPSNLYMLALHNYLIIVFLSSFQFLVTM